MPIPASPAENAPPKDDDLRALLNENLALTRAILEQTNKTRRWILFGQIAGVIKIVLVVAPLIAGVIYLGPLLKQALVSYQDLLGGGVGGGALPGGGPWESALQNKLKDLRERVPME